MHNKSSFHQCQPPIVPRYGPHQAEKLSPKSSVRHDPATRDSYSRTSSSRNPPISPYLTGSTLLPATRKVARAHLRATPIPFFSTHGVRARRLPSSALRFTRAYYRFKPARPTGGEPAHQQPTTTLPSTLPSST